MTLIVGGVEFRIRYDITMNKNIGYVVCYCCDDDKVQDVIDKVSLDFNCDIHL